MQRQAFRGGGLQDGRWRSSDRLGWCAGAREREGSLAQQGNPVKNAVKKGGLHRFISLDLNKKQVLGTRCLFDGCERGAMVNG
jgi:hypothetical protein